MKVKNKLKKSYGDKFESTEFLYKLCQVAVFITTP